MNTYTERQIEEINLKVGTGTEAIAKPLAIDSLLLIAKIGTEHAERDVERDIIHYKYTDARREGQACLHVSGMSLTQFAVEGAVEIAIARCKSEFYLIEDAEAPATSDTRVLLHEDCSSVRLLSIIDIMKIEIHILINIHLKRIDIGHSAAIGHSDTYGEIVANKI